MQTRTIYSFEGKDGTNLSHMRILEIFTMVGRQVDEETLKAFGFGTFRSASVAEKLSAPDLEGLKAMQKLSANQFEFSDAQTFHDFIKMLATRQRSSANKMEREGNGNGDAGSLPEAIEAAKELGRLAAKADRMVTSFFVDFMNAANRASLPLDEDTSQTSAPGMR